MKRYIITSSRIGQIGTELFAQDNYDIEYLLAGGFIQPYDTHPSKGAKLSKKPDATEPKE